MAMVACVLFSTADGGAGWELTCAPCVFWPMAYPYRHLLTQFGVWTSHPVAFGIVAVYVLAWLVISPRSFDWQSTATVSTWIMTLFIQRAEHRDTQAIHAKLDELLRVEKMRETNLRGWTKKSPKKLKVIDIRKSKTPSEIWKKPARN